MMSESDFDIVIAFMVEKEFVHTLKGGKLYVLAKSMQEISDELVSWAEKTGLVDQAEFSLIDDLYDMKAEKGKPKEFCTAPNEIKDMIMYYT